MDLSIPLQSAKRWRTDCETVRKKSISHGLIFTISASSLAKTNASSKEGGTLRKLQPQVQFCYAARTYKRSGTPLPIGGPKMDVEIQLPLELTLAREKAIRRSQQAGYGPCDHTHPHWRATRRYAVIKLGL
jgi:hypothetical protein